MLKSHRLTRAAGALVAALLILPLAACGGAGGGNDKVTIGLSYVPNIQFAPFYVADALGYYKDAGLTVQFRHHTVGSDLFGPLVAGQEDLLFAGGDETLKARGKGPQLVYVAQVFNQYPVALIVPADSPIRSVSDLKGRSVGVPGQYGATWIGLLALLKGAGLTAADVNIQSIGFTQVAALLGKQVDAVIGYVNNEPIQLEKAGLAVRTFPVADSGQPLVSNGIVALQATLDKRPDDVKKVVAATLKGVEYALANPQQTVEISKKYVPDLSSPRQAADALAVLQATLPLWQSSGQLGASDPANWRAMAQFLLEAGELDAPMDVSKAYNAGFLPAP